jgi:hypothetical protein
MTPEDVRRIALSFPETSEDLHRGKPTFRIRKRIFARLGVDQPTAGTGFYAPLSGPRPVVSLTLDRDDQLNLAAAFPEAIVAAGRYGFSYVWLDAVEPDTLEMLLRMSWARVAPKRLVA